MIGVNNSLRQPIFLVALLSISFQALAVSSPLTVSVNIIGVSKVKFSLKNEGKTSLYIFYENLPWAPSQTTTSLAICDIYLGDCLGSRPPPPAHRDGQKVEVLPGRAVEGEIDLDDRFRGFTQAIKNPKHRPLIFYWSHKAQLVDGPPIDRQGGWLVIGEER